MSTGGHTPRSILEDDGLHLPVLNHYACFTCRGITMEALTSSAGYRHHMSRDELLRAAEAGCRICLWICEVLAPDTFMEETGGPGACAPKFDPNDLWLYPFPPVLRFDPSICAVTISPILPTMIAKNLSVFANEGDRVGDVIPTRRILIRSTLSSTLDRFGPLLAKSDPADSVDPPDLPRRVIDLGGQASDIVYLRDFGDSPLKAHYICLSHRWAQSKPLTSKVETVAERQKGIIVSELSTTLQDAICMARGLNIRYLWIDSLCILQDSNVDWETESAKMGKYYSRGWLTLAAGLHADADAGLFGCRSVIKSGRGYCRLAFPRRNSEPSFLYFTGDDERRQDDRDLSLIYARGWKLQEEALSPRFLCFQPRQTSLRIDDVVYHESGYSEQRSKTNYLNVLQSLDARSWCRLIEDYSRRQLTNEEDKLPALSGLAHQYSQDQSDFYLAGIWIKSLAEQLCWCVDYSTSISSPVIPSAYRAPSWSWASIDAPVIFDDSTNFPQGQTLEILDISTTAYGRDPYGRVKNGSILLKAYTCRQLWKRRHGVNRGWYYVYPLGENTNPSIVSSNVPYSNASLVLDIPEPLSDELEIWSLPIKKHFALALQPVKRLGGIFTRVGAICFRGNKDEGNSCEVQTITIL